MDRWFTKGTDLIETEEKNDKLSLRVGSTFLWCSAHLLPEEAEKLAKILLAFASKPKGK